MLYVPLFERDPSQVWSFVEMSYAWGPSIVTLCNIPPNTAGGGASTANQKEQVKWGKKAIDKIGFMHCVEVCLLAHMFYLLR